MVTAAKLASPPPSGSLSATALAAEIRAGRRSVVDVVEEHIARLQAPDVAKLNALCAERFAAAREEAAAADALLARPHGELPALFGVPCTIKDSIDVEGLASTFGIASRKDHRAEADADVVARLKAAGAIVLGKTNVAQLLMFYETDNPLFGRTLHPLDVERSPGGSSGGQAALVAAGAVSFGLGSDLAGSCRVPAASCGVVGFKPTGGRVDDPGRCSIAFGQRAVPSQIGVLARDVDDAWLAFRIAHGDAERVDAPALRDPAKVDVTKLTVGVFDDDGMFPACPAARRAVPEAARVLERAGVTVKRVKPPHLEEMVRLCYGIFGADGGTGFARALAGSARDPQVKPLLQSAAMPKWFLRILAAVFSATHHENTAAIVSSFGAHDVDTYWQRVERLHDIRASFWSSLGVDALLSPPSPLPAFRHGACIELALCGAYACMMNALGAPAGVVPFTRVRPGEESDRAASKEARDVVAQETERGSVGLPIGVQLAAKPWHDEHVFALMKLVAQHEPR